MTTVLVLLLLIGAILPKTASKEKQLGAAGVLETASKEKQLGAGVLKTASKEKQLGAGVLGSLLPPNYDKMTAPPHVEGEKAEILVDLEVLGIPRLDEVVCKRTVLGRGKAEKGTSKNPFSGSRRADA